jgi:hypothetical protein
MPKQEAPIGGWGWLFGRRRPKPIPQSLPAREQRISFGAQQRAAERPARPDGQAIFAAYKPVPGTVPSGMAADAAIMPLDPGVMSWAAEQDYHEGLRFMGYPYLAELAQRPEYRKMAEKWAEHATRKWVKITGDKERVAQINAELDRLNVRMVFREAFEHDGLFGRSQIFLDFGDADNAAELGAKLAIDARKVGTARPLKGVKAVEPMWSYPARYNTRNPLAPDFYRPESWFVYGRTVHASRLLTMVGREVPDMLKPSYAFGGLSLTQMAKPYVDNWLRTRQSVSDLVDAFSTMVLSTDMTQVLAGDSGETLFARVDLFNMTRSNRGTMVIDKANETLTNVSTPLSGLDALQAQAQEQMASVSSMPLLILLGISPTGLNATSDGELRTFYADVKAYQEKVARQPFKTILDLVQLSLFDAVDAGIGFEFQDLWEMNDSDKAAIRKSDAEAATAYINAGVIDPEEERDRLRTDETSLYHGVDLSGEAPADDREEDDDASAALLRAA